MKIGYARVRTKDKSLNLQLDALREAGCEEIYKEKESGAKSVRPKMEKMIQQLRKGDTVIVWKLDRLGRSIRELIRLITKFKEQGVTFQSLQDNINTSTPTGKRVFHLFAALAEFERDIIRERTKAGLAAARARGRKGGRPKGLSKKAQHTAIIAEKLYLEGVRTVKEICEQLSISKGTFTTTFAIAV